MFRFGCRPQMSQSDDQGSHDLFACLVLRGKGKVHISEKWAQISTIKYSRLRPSLDCSGETRFYKVAARLDGSLGGLFHIISQLTIKLRSA